MVGLESARLKLTELQQRVDNGYVPPTKDETLSQLLERWHRDVLSTQVKPLARENYRYDGHIVPTLGNKAVAKLTVADVQRLLATKL